MWGSTIPTVYYGFYCDPRLQRLYWSVVSCSSIRILLTPPFFQRLEIRKLTLHMSYATVTGHHTSCCLCSYHSQPKVSPSKSPALSGCHVFWSWSFRDRLHLTWTCDSWLGGPE